MTNTTHFPSFFSPSGPSAASEPETLAIQNVAKDLSAKVQVWISYHGSRTHNVILSPFSWTCDELPADSDDIIGASLTAVREIRKVFNFSHEGDDAYWRTGEKSCLLV